MSLLVEDHGKNGHMSQVDISEYKFKLFFTIS